MSTRRYDFLDEDDDEFQRTLSNLVNQRVDDDDGDVEVGGAFSRRLFTSPLRRRAPWRRSLPRRAPPP